jgi:glycosyltransferase involved in cell wall biosynthesis
MRILVVQDAGWTNKGPHQQHHLMERLSVNGNEIQVVGYDQLWRMGKKSLISLRNVQSHVQRFYKDADIDYVSPTFIRLPFLDYLSLFVTFRREIKRSIKRFRPDVIIGFTSVISSYWGATLAEAMNVPYIDYWTDAIDSLVPFRLLMPVAKLIKRSTIEKAALVLAINEALQDYVVAMGADPSLTRVLPGGVDLQIFNPAKTDSQRVREKYHLSTNDVVLFFMGWIYAFSGLREVVATLLQNRGSHPQLKLLVVGEGDFYPALREIVQKDHSQDRVILTGAVSYAEIPEFIAAADVALLPAYSNDVMQHIVPIKIYEYLAMHKPVICTKLPGIAREFGSDCGIVYVDTPQDVIELAAGLSQADIETLATQAKRCIKDYSWDKITARFEEMLASVVRTTNTES